MRNEGVVLVIVIRVTIRIRWRGEVREHALAPWRLVLPRGQVLPERAA
jgi:hypothetical protein